MAAKLWSEKEWEEFILKDKNYWQMVENLLCGHPKLYQAGSFNGFFVCTACDKFFTVQEAHSCPTGRLLAWSNVSQGNEEARKAFVRAWLKSIFYKLPKGLKPWGAAKEVPAQLLDDFKHKLLENADSLIDEAILLFENKKYPRASFLALVAQEELVKMVWASIESQNRTTHFYLFPIEGCKPGFTFQRLSLAIRGLRLETHSSGLEEFKWKKEYDLLQHDTKLALVKLPSNYFLNRLRDSILQLEHYDKYRLLYARTDKSPEQCRYVDFDFHHGTVISPDKAVSREQAYDHILFAAALCHDWAEHGFCNHTGKVSVVGPYNEFRERAHQRYQDFMNSHCDCQSQIFPTPKLTDEEKAKLESED